MQQQFRQYILTGSITLAMLGLLACSGGAGRVAPMQSPAPQNPAAPVAGVGEGNRLILSLPSVADLAAGSEFEAALHAEFAGEVFQGSTRIGYDPAVLEVLDAERGELLPPHMLHVAGLTQSGYVPFAFTAQPGEAAVEEGSGELLRLHFRLLKAHSGRTPITLINEPEFLQLRDRQGRRLPFDIASEIGAAQEVQQ